jgi:two-component system phosphate regulon sensor histidine kinase PhoR
MKKAVWGRELLRGAAWAAVGALAGFMLGSVTAGVLVGLCGLLLLYVHYLVALRVWLDKPKRMSLPDPSGTWGEVFDALIDLQKRNRKRKRRLAEIVAEFQASTEALPDGAVVLGPRGEIGWFNKAAQALLGLRLPQDLGLRLQNLVRKTTFTDYFAKGDFSGEIEATSPINPEITLSYRVIPYGNGQRLLIVRDVSELKRLEIARRDFVANASHELRTPLTVLRGYVDMMEMDARTDGPLKTWHRPLSEMRSQVVRMEALVNDLLKLARLESEIIHTRQDMVDVPQQLAQLREEALAMSHGQHAIRFDVDPTLCLFGRDSEIYSVFANLVTNAIQYTAPGGIIDVRWTGDEQGAHFAVADTGIGIDARDVPRLTERFYRVDVGRSRASGGTGLGLSIVQQALSHHEGRLQIDSEPGVGSTFTCHFPPHRVHRSPATAETQPAGNSPTF